MTPMRAFAIVGLGLAVVGAVGALVVRIVAPVPFLPVTFGFGPAAMIAFITHRVRRDVDRRFNRARYDAEQTVAAFSARVRDEVDIAAVSTDLHATVHGAIKPAVLGLRIREARP